MLMIVPIVMGAGRRLFENGVYHVALKLVDARPFSAGALGVTYEPAGTRWIEATKKIRRS